jgi:hypothetical protein
MNDTRQKTNAAISAAVMAYIKSEEEMAAVADLVAAAKGSSALERGPFEVKNSWGLDGRQQIMQARTMMQLKAFYR